MSVPPDWKSHASYLQVQQLRSCLLPLRYFHRILGVSSTSDIVSIKVVLSKQQVCVCSYWGIMKCLLSQIQLWVLCPCFIFVYKYWQGTILQGRTRGEKHCVFHPSPASSSLPWLYQQLRELHGLQPQEYTRQSTTKWPNSRSKTWCDFGTKERLHQLWPEDSSRDVRKKGKPKRGWVASNLTGGHVQAWLLGN